MRTSNKILLITFIVCLAGLTSINLGLYAKYKKGEITIVKKSAEFEQHQLPVIRYVELRGLGNIHIYPSDAYRLDIKKQPSSTLTFRVQDSTLVILGDSTRDSKQKAKSSEPDNAREDRAVDLYIDAVDRISSTDCDITLHGSKDSIGARSYVFNLRGTYLSIGSRIDRNGRIVYRNNDSSVYFWNDINVQATQSVVGCENRGRIELLHVSLAGSKVMDHDFSIGKLAVTSDESSTIEWHGRNAAALNGSLK